MASFVLRSLATAAVFSIAGLAAALPGCGAKKGGLMLAITTDLQTPKDISVVSLTIKSGSAVKHNIIGRVRPDGTVEMPGTIAIVEPDDPNLTIRVRVIAFQDRKPRVLRDIRTTVPRAGRTALLNVPLTFVNDGSATGELPAQFLPPGPGVPVGPVTEDEFDPYGASVVSLCADPDQTVIDGACKDSFIDSATLPDYDDTLVFGAQGRSGPCFAPPACLAGAKPFAAASVVVDAAGRCVVPLAGPAANVNLALATTDTGACFDGRCFVPIDNGDAGWRVVGPNIEVAAPLCKLITSKRAELYGSSGPCPAKLPSQPLCSGASPRTDAGLDGPAFDGGAAELVMPENFPTGVALVGPDIYVVGEQGLSVVVPGQPGKRVDAVVARPGPRFITAGPVGVAIAEGSNSGYVVEGPTAAAIAFNPGNLQTQAVAFVGGSGPQQAYIWAVDTGAGGSPGIFTSDATGSALLPGGVPTVGTTSVAVLPGAAPEMLFGTAGGAIFHCALGPTSVQCGSPQPTGGSGRIEAMRTILAPERVAFFLQGNAVHRVDAGATFSAQMKFTKLVDNAGVNAFVKGPLYPRGVAATSRCVFYSSQTGIEWVKTAGGTPTTLADARPGVALGIEIGPGGPSNAPYVYWALFGALDAKGGAYRVPVPAECLP